MNIQVLYFEGCPNHAPTVALVREVVADLDLNAHVEEVQVTTQTEAERLRFLGSPTVQVNGVDIEPSAREQTNYALSCRMYNGSGIPPRELLVQVCEVSH
ncbi:MAG: thioredoxin family protein [Candidatus Binatia bacterium]